MVEKSWTDPIIYHNVYADLIQVIHDNWFSSEELKVNLKKICFENFMIGGPDLYDTNANVRTIILYIVSKPLKPEKLTFSIWNVLPEKRFVRLPVVCDKVMVKRWDWESWLTSACVQIESNKQHEERGKKRRQEERGKRRERETKERRQKWQKKPSRGLKRAETKKSSREGRRVGNKEGKMQGQDNGWGIVRRKISMKERKDRENKKVRTRVEDRREEIKQARKWGEGASGARARRKDERAE